MDVKLTDWVKERYADVSIVFLFHFRGERDRYCWCRKTGALSIVIITRATQRRNRLFDFGASRAADVIRLE